MSTDIAPRGATDLSIAPGQTFFSDKQVAALRQLGVSGASNADLAVFFHQSVRTGLDPFARQIYMIERQGKQTIQTGIDGFRLVARRATDRVRGTFGYEDTLWCGEDGRWVDVWLTKEPPAAAKVTVVRDGQRYPAIALWNEYAATKRDGSITAMWASKPALMLAKCAEALALRRAFPQDLSGIYTADEVDARGGDIESPADDTAASAPSARSGTARLRAAVPTASEASPSTDEVAAAFETPVPAATPANGNGTSAIGAGRDEDVHDAEVVDAPAAEPMTTAQNRKIHALFRDLGIDSEDRQRAGMSKALGRPVTSRKDLTKDEAAFIIESLEHRLAQQQSQPAPADDVQWPPVADIPGGAS